MTSAIQIENLSFTYRGNTQKTLDQIYLNVGEGERYGIFGPNGAGKTTLINIMTGLLSYTGGSVKIFGKEVTTNRKWVKSLFGFVPQDFSFYNELTPVENMEFFGAWSGLNKKKISRKTDELLEIMHLQDARNQPVGKFSGGMKRRVNLAIAVIHEPRLLFLDEPTVGVDVQSRHAIIEYLIKLNEKGTTLVYTSHQLNEAEDLCNTIALLDQSKIIGGGSLQDLLKRHHKDKLEDLFLELTGRAYRDGGI